jgi:hypothetical protein
MPYKITSAKYRKAFRDAYNNPTQYNSFVEKAKENPSVIDNETKAGIVFGVEKRKKLIAEGKGRFIWTEKDLDEVIE